MLDGSGFEINSSLKPKFLSIKCVFFVKYFLKTRFNRFVGCVESFLTSFKGASW